MLAIAKSLDVANNRIGQIVSVTPLLLVLVQFTLVLMVHVFGIGSVKAQESLQYINALMFMGGVGYTALAGEHVRVDIFFHKMEQGKRDLVDFFGTLFFIVPLCILLWLTATPFALNSWQGFEGSTETTGLHLVYILKTMPLLFTFSLSIFAVANVIRLGHALLKKDSGAE